jgi:hypothetical protein
VLEEDFHTSRMMRKASRAAPEGSSHSSDADETMLRGSKRTPEMEKSKAQDETRYPGKEF